MESGRELEEVEPSKEDFWLLLEDSNIEKTALLEDFVEPATEPWIEDF